MGFIPQARGKSLIQSGKHLVKSRGTGASGLNLFHATANLLFPSVFNIGRKIPILVR